MQSVYPDYKWDVYQFSQIPNGYKTNLLENPSLQKEFVNYLEKKFDIKQTVDWYSVTSGQVKQVLDIDLHVAMEIIKKYYPDIDVGNLQFGSSKTKNKNE